MVHQEGFFGYEDIGDGQGDKPATHVMMLMVMSLNMGWKLPIAYSLLPDSFPCKKRAELLCMCIYRLNLTGAIVTNIVMDNCPVNYSTFRLLGRVSTEVNFKICRVMIFLRK